MPRLQALSASIVRMLQTEYIHTWEKIMARVFKYKAPSGCKHLPMLTLTDSWCASDRVFVGQSLDLLQKGERLGYVKISTIEYK